MDLALPPAFVRARIVADHGTGCDALRKFLGDFPKTVTGRRRARKAYAAAEAETARLRFDGVRFAARAKGVG